MTTRFNSFTVQCVTGMCGCECVECMFAWVGACGSMCGSVCGKTHVCPSVCFLLLLPGLKKVNGCDDFNPGQFHCFAFCHDFVKFQCKL